VCWRDETHLLRGGVQRSYVDCACTCSEALLMSKSLIIQHGMFCWQGEVESEVCEVCESWRM
jgi:hypothetical protein